MSIVQEIKKIRWQIASYTDFVSSKVAVYGWYSTHNIGDDAALVSLENYLDDGFAVITPQTYKRIPSNLKVLICGGGGWFNRDAPLHFLKYLKRVKNRSFPCLLLAAGINHDLVDGDINENNELFKEFLSCFDYISVRDSQTQSLVNRLGFDQCELMADLVLNIPFDGINAPEKQLDKKTVGLVLASHSKTFLSQKEEVLDFLCCEVQRIIEQGYRVVCLPFQVDTTSKASKAVDERKTALELKNRLKSDKFEVLHEAFSPLEMLGYMRENISITASMRLHGNVMSALCGIPFVSLSYNQKHAGFLDMMELKGYDIALLKETMKKSELSGKIKEIEKQYTFLHKQVSSKVTALKEVTNSQILSLKQKYEF